MADGYLFFVAHSRDGAPPLHVTYAVGAEGESRARAVLEKEIASFFGTITIEEMRPLSPKQKSIN